MDVVGSAAKFSRRGKEKAEVAGRGGERCTAAKREDRSPKDKKRKFRPHAIHTLRSKSESLVSHPRNLRRSSGAFREAARKALAHFARRDLSILVVSAALIEPLPPLARGSISP